ncbi:MAG: murein biosynthesis integral membrane protein MurJ [Opitutales bacterium]|nr:murein biosynthesis integral membrane protein MurJ [Opitutales bacterium]
MFGTGEYYSAFVTAFSLPNLFRRLLGEGSLTAAFVPTLQEELHERGRPGAFALLNQVVSWLAVVTGVMVALAMLAFSQSRLLPGHEPRWYLAADLTVLLFPYLALICLAAALNATLNVLERFTEPALSPIWLNLAMILSLGGAGWNLADTELGRMHWLCAGVLAGGCLQLLVPAGVLLRAGWRPRWDLGVSPRVRAIAALMAPGLFGSAIYQINVYISRLFAFSIDTSSAALLFSANRLMELPIGVFAIAVATVVYPLIARHAAEGNHARMAEDYRKGLRLILVINLPAAAGLALLSEPIVRLLFQHGRFAAADTRAMAPLLALFALGLPFFSVVSLTTRAFYAVKDTVTPVKPRAELAAEGRPGRARAGAGEHGGDRAADPADAALPGAGAARHGAGRPLAPDRPGAAGDAGHGSGRGGRRAAAPGGRAFPPAGGRPRRRRADSPGRGGLRRRAVAAARRAAQPHRRFADVPVRGHRRAGGRVAPGAPRGARRGRRRPRHRGGHRRGSRRAHHPGRPRALGRRAGRAAGAHHAFPAPARRRARHSAGPRRAQGRRRPPLGGRGAPDRRRRRLDPGCAEPGGVRRRPDPGAAGPDACRHPAGAGRLCRGGPAVARGRFRLAGAARSARSGPSACR